MTTPNLATPTPVRRRNPLLALPLLGFVLLAALFGARLMAGDPSRLPSALIGQPAPPFDLPGVPGLDRPGFASADLRRGQVTLVNVFASWCAECHEEHAALMQLAADPALKESGVVLNGIAYKDKAEDARRYLGGKGNPYAAVGEDASGRVGIDLGVYGVPETFVVRGNGTIAYKLIGAVTPDTVGPLRQAIAQAAGAF